jgi:enterochelin esterase family protein
LLYQPDCADPCPLLLVLDGQDYRSRGKIVNIVNNLINDNRIGPIAMAMVHHGGRQRFTEYSCSELHLGFLLNCVLPLAKRFLNLRDETEEPGVHGILGASMGGLMATYVGLRLPNIFGHVLSQSGAFSLDDRDTVVWDLVRHGPVRPVRIWMDAGRYEWLLECNHGFHQHLRSRDYDATYHEFNAGHNHAAWSNDVWRGLESSFGAGHPQGAEV